MRRVLIVAGSSSQLDHLRWDGSIRSAFGGREVIVAVPDDLERAGLPGEARAVKFRYDQRSVAAGGRDRETGTVRRFLDRPGFRWRYLEKIFRGLMVPIRWWEPRGIVRFLRVSPQLLLRAMRFAPIVLRALPGVYSIWRPLTLAAACRGCGIRDVIELERPDAVVLLYKQQDGYTIATQFACARVGLPCIVLPLKWDNATSKTVFRIRPDRLAVFSKSVAKGATWIHGLSAHSVVPVGSAQTDAELLLASGTPHLSTSPSVLALGFGDPRAELREWLPLLSRTVSERSRGGASSSIHWRPYPAVSEAQRSMLIAAAAELPHVSLDQDVLAARSHRAEDQPAAAREAAFERYVGTLMRAELVVSGPTSAVLDARMLGLAVIIPAFREGARLCDAAHLLRVYTHMKGLWNTNGVFIAETEEDFVRLVNDFLDNPRRIPPDKSGEHIFVDDRTYAQRLIDVIEDAIAEKDRERASATV